MQKSRRGTKFRNSIAYQYKEAIYGFCWKADPIDVKYKRQNIRVPLTSSMFCAASSKSFCVVWGFLFLNALFPKSRSSETRPLTDFQEHMTWGNMAPVLCTTLGIHSTRAAVSLSERWTCQIWGYPVAWLSPGCTHTESSFEREQLVLHEGSRCSLENQI